MTTQSTIHSTTLTIAVLVSGSGTNLQTLIDAQHAGELSINIIGVISNRTDAYAIERATNAGIDTRMLSHTDAGKRMTIATFERHALQQLQEWQPDLVVLAGFMRVLSGNFINNCPAPMINLHPSLLPKYKGLDTHARVLASSDREHGCSVHMVSAELDAGQVLTQAVLTIKHDDTAESLQQRVQQLEYQLLPYTLALIANGMFINQLALDDDTLHKRLQRHQSATVAQCLPKLPWKIHIDNG